jgi:hypothetical protein
MQDAEARNAICCAPRRNLTVVCGCFFGRCIIAITGSIQIGSPPNYPIALPGLRQELNNVILSKVLSAFLHDVLRILFSKGGQRTAVTQACESGSAFARCPPCVRASNSRINNSDAVDCDVICVVHGRWI